MANTQAEVDSETKAAQEKVVQNAYTKATSTLKQRHKSEWIDLVRRFAAEEGVEWNPRPTAEERAAERVRALVEEFGEEILPDH